MLNKIRCLIFCLFLLSSVLHTEIVTRAAFDFGSGKIKMQVAEVDTLNHTIVKVLYEKSIAVLLALDAGKHQGVFSQEIQEEALSVTRDLKQKAIELGAQEFAGIATEAYRKAVNAQQLLNSYATELNIPVHLISQEEEGTMGFFAFTVKNNFDPHEIIYWDIGGGSLQITYLDDEGNIELYMAPFGRTTAKNTIIQQVKGQDFSIVNTPNPMSLQDWNCALLYFNAVLPDIPKSLEKKLQKPDIKIFANSRQFAGRLTYNAQEILDALTERLGKTDEELAAISSSPSTEVSQLALCYSVITKLKLPLINYQHSLTGSTPYLLIADEFWQNYLIH